MVQDFCSTVHLLWMLRWSANPRVHSIWRGPIPLVLALVADSYRFWVSIHPTLYVDAKKFTLFFLENFAVAQSVCRSFQTASTTQPHFTTDHSSSMSALAQSQVVFAHRPPPRSYASFPPTTPPNLAYFGNYAASTPILPTARNAITASIINDSLASSASASSTMDTSGRGGAADASHYLQNTCRFSLGDSPPQARDFQRCASFAALPTTPQNDVLHRQHQAAGLNRSYSCVIKYTSSKFH